jgi:DNA adenine methylase
MQNDSSELDQYENRKLRSPIRWAGGKSRLTKNILELMPPHDRYVEPFAGGAWVLFSKPSSNSEVINDLDPELINFYRVIQTKPGDFLQAFEWVLVSRQWFNELAEQDPTTLDPVERAFRFYYLQMAGWGGESKYPRFYVSIGDVQGHGNRLIGALKTLDRRILPASRRLQGVEIQNLSWEVCIKAYDQKGTWMYLDPPYPGNPVNYACNMKTWKEHAQLAKRLRKTSCHWLLSLYDTPQIRELYAGFEMTPVTFRAGMKDKEGACSSNRELLIGNYDIGHAQSE